jgi:hypothetical protein
VLQYWFQVPPILTFWLNEYRYEFIWDNFSLVRSTVAKTGMGKIIADRIINRWSKIVPLIEGIAITQCYRADQVSCTIKNAVNFLVTDRGGPFICCMLSTSICPFLSKTKEYTKHWLSVIYIQLSDKYKVKKRHARYEMEPATLVS